MLTEYSNAVERSFGTIAAVPGVDGRDNPRIKSGDGHDGKDLGIRGHALPVGSDARRPEVFVLPPDQAAPSTSERTEPQTRLNLNRIRSAIPKIAPVFRNTPQYTCPALGEALDCEIILKLETANPVRCFKARGAETVMARLAEKPGSRSAVCASAGNLGLSLAWSGRSRGI